MKKTEQLRLKKLVQDVLQSLEVPPLIESRVQKCAKNFSPTNAARYREAAEIVWWLVAVDAPQDALRLLDALCAINDEYYWMFQALASAFASRAWIHGHQKNARLSKSDAKAAFEWLGRDPNSKRITKSEATYVLVRFDDWLARADNEKGTMIALEVLSHALRVLVIYQQAAKAGCVPAKAVPSREYSSRMKAGIAKLRQRLDIG